MDGSCGGGNSAGNPVRLSPSNHISFFTMSLTTSPILNLSVRNTTASIGLGLMAVMLLAPFYWAPLTGEPYTGDYPTWAFVLGALVLGWGAYYAGRPKSVTVSLDRIQHVVAGKSKFDLPWAEVTEVSNCVRSIASRPATNIQFRAQGGKVHELDGLGFDDKTLKKIYRSVATDIIPAHPHLSLKDHGGWTTSSVAGK